MKNNFIKISELKVEFNEISKITNNANKLMKLPQFIQNKIVRAAKKKGTYMGFIVEPYSFFMAYEITDSVVKQFLPENYELAECSLFQDEKLRKCAILGCFNVRTTVFMGMRFELYVIARNKKTNLLSWLICECESDTYNYSPGSGFIPKTLERSVLTTSFEGNLICDIMSINKKTNINFVANLKENNFKKLNQELWIDGNLSVDYSGNLEGKEKSPFGLIFHPGEMKEAKKIKVEDVNINKLNIGFLDETKKPFSICCFPYSQHYLTTIFPLAHTMKDETDLYKKVEEIIEDSN